MSERLLKTEGLSEACATLARDPGSGRRLAAMPSRIREAALATRPIWSGRGADTAIIATGHQSTFRHPGILAKDLLAAAIADALGGSVFRLLVDQDVHAIGPLRVPDQDPAGRLRAFAIPCEEPHRDCPTGCRPPISLLIERLPQTVPPEWANRAAAIAERLRAAADMPSAALQVAHAFDALAAPIRTFATPHAATALLATPIGEAILEAIAENPQRCAACFNDALRLDPRAARPLSIEDNRVEVPLWAIDWCRPRERVHLDQRESRAQRLDRLREAAAAGPPRLAPRGLLMTGLVRMVSDLFIHGRGGWRYDRVTERWFADWLGVTLSPMVMATADLRLPLGETAASTESLRRRWHDPTARDSSGPSVSKRALLHAIAAAPRGSAVRRAAFRAMHRQLDEARRTCSTPPPPPRGDDAAAIAASREWAFPLVPRDELDRLASEAEGAAGTAWTDAESA